MIEFRSIYREKGKDLEFNSIDDVSHILNYAIDRTIEKNYKGLSPEIKQNATKKIISEVLQGRYQCITRQEFPFEFDDGYKGLRSIISELDPKLIKYSILNANILSYAYTSDICQKLGGYTPNEEIAKNITAITYAGNLDENMDKLFENENILNGMISNYLYMTFNDKLLFYNRVVSAAYSDPQISSALQQLEGLEQSLDMDKGNIR